MEIQCAIKEQAKRDNLFTVSVLQRCYKLVSELKEYKDLEEQKKLLKLPCEIVDKLKKYAAEYNLPPFGIEIEGTPELLSEAAKMIEVLSAKLAVATPKRPLEYEEHESYDEGICPICGEPVCHVYAYCPRCGQHLKWGSDTEESETTSMERSMENCGGWISCKRKMPKVGRPVLVCDKQGNVCVRTITCKIKGKKYWSKNKCDVVAWKPLPEPNHSYL